MKTPKGHTAASAGSPQWPKRFGCERTFLEPEKRQGEAIIRQFLEVEISDDVALALQKDRGHLAQELRLAARSNGMNWDCSRRVKRPPPLD